MEAANDCLLAGNGGEGGIFDAKAQAGEKPYNVDELWIGKQTVDNMI